MKSHTTMNSFPVKLSPEESAELDRLFPPSPGSSDIGKRAVAIAEIYFRRKDPHCKFVDPPRGADLAVVLEMDGRKFFEVKGTADSDIAWQKLKVSSQSSHDLLKEGSASVLRVTDVFGAVPVVYELRCGQHFQLEPEPRWTFKPVHGA